ncbi:hypothetical protein [Dyella amyloliquefaciens]|uniref:hypothetical protein n=1 Tax=Dyella amyloliquefaciens TaxID=1770545 RepID=UPI00102E689A|nr:hypothetical protein [Dyella amyloliquefaciens]
MATHDHTGRIRPFVPPASTLPPPSDDLSRVRVTWPDSPRHSTRGDIALAVLSLTRLRYDSEQCRKAQARGFPGRPLEWPLPVALTASLGTAIHCLQQYASLLGHDSRVNTPRVR